MKKKLVIGITGASGAPYAKALIEKVATLQNQVEACGLVMSESAKVVWETELGKNIPMNFPFPIYARDNFMAPFASGSAGYEAMIICPCSTGTMGRIAGGISNDLMTRAADVMLKERRKLVLVLRETPLNLVHIRNMETITLAGGIICPASPSFYSQPETVDALVNTVVDRALQLAGFDAKGFRWGS
ncbi:MAG: UbiX family flavin prenyltransferase [Flavobacteriales bacterium]|nr:UbiX family flavin prenyltransferase [Flavobacteriales bacterium]